MGGLVDTLSEPESQKKNGIELVFSDTCKELYRRLHPFVAGTIPDYPSSTRVLVAHLDFEKQMTMGQNPNRTPSEHPIQSPLKIDQNGWCTYPKMVPLVFDP